ncbi:universal stress protein Slr1101-like [Clytia hemisphaerica]|uniref:UspA domain-containing protein n=1 Tax=Clytia hemisphaerica TaxID=252671 RepID=A0A7M5WZP8_9CNID
MASKGNLNLLCVDGSSHSDRAFEWYSSHYHREGDRIGICTIHEIPYVPMGLYEDGLMLSEAAYPQLLNDSVNKSKEICETFKQRCLDIAKVNPEIYCITAEDSVGNTICKVAKDNNASTIIIGQRGLGAIRRTLLGSVSDYVVHHSHIPTIVVPATQ